MKITIDLSDLKGSRKLMDEQVYGTTSLIGNNDHGEKTYASISKESIIIETYQENGWVRQNWLHYDGSREEIFDRRWKTGRKTFIVTIEISANDKDTVHAMIDKLVLDERTISFKVEEE